MAEVLGVFASGIAVAQLAGSIVASSRKIYTFWANFKDAPKNATDLITEVELLGALEFYDKHSNSGQNNSAIMREIVKPCRDVMKELDEILRRMEEGMKEFKGKVTRQWTGAKMALKGHIVQDLTNRLERAKSLLILARSFNAESIDMTLVKFLESTSQQISSPYPAQTDVIAPSKGSSVHNSKNVHDCNRGRRSSNEDNNTPDNELVGIDIEIQFLPRAWLKMKEFSIIQSRWFGQWKHSYQSVCIIPDDSPIFTACSNGDQNEIIRLIKAKKGSGFDVKEGWTLIHIVDANMRHELCRWLILNGARSGDTDIRIGWIALHVAAEFSGRPTPTIENYGKDFQPEDSTQHQEMMIRPAAEVLDTIRVLVEFGQCGPMEAGPVIERCEESSRTLNHCCRSLAALDLYSGPPEAFRYLLEQDEFVV